MFDPWPLLLILGPLLLLGVIVYATWRNRQARKKGGDAALGTTNAVHGSEHESAESRRGGSG